MCFTGWSIWTLLLTVHAISGADDPCSPEVYRRLPSLESRYDHYYTKPTSVNQDSGLITGWYYTGSLTLLNHRPHNNWACGTEFPIWQEDPQPNLAVNEEKELGLCLFGFHEDCEEVLYVRIKLCPDNVYVYRLAPTPSDSAYCFGEGKRGTAPTYTPAMKPVGFDIQQLVDTSRRRQSNYTEVYFICNFIPSTNKELWYRVYWYQNGVALYTTGFSKTTDNTDLTLTEPRFVEKGFKLGNEISCVAQAFNEEEGPPGPRSERSKPFYAGIQVLTETLRFEFGEQSESKRKIRLKRTIPIGCLAKDKCRIELLATIPDGVNDKQCTGITLQGRRCGIEIWSDDAIEEEINIIVKAADVGQYTELDIFNEVHLRVAETKNNKIWGNYALEPVKVHMTSPGVKRSFGARCDANNDPHMRTFDLLYYELQPRYGHHKGVYTLYHNERFDTWVFLQVTPCGSAYCNCGVAAIAGQDVFYIDCCDGAVGIDYKSCGDKVLEVKSYTELKYEIYFPYGTYVQVDIFKWRETLIGVHVQPSIYDEGTTSGLCGSLDGNKGNDFTDKTGTIVTRDQFLDSWRLDPQEAGKDVFDQNFDLTVLKPMIIDVCICKVGLNDGQALRDEVSCNKNAVASCRKGKDTSKDMCTSNQGRKRRSIERSPKKPKVTIKPFGFRHKRQTITWTRETARAFCTNYMKDSPVYAACEQVQNARPEGAIDDCVEDIMLSGGTEWAQISQETMRSTCTSELSRNISLWESTYDTPSIAETIERMACINNCSQQGVCNEGECECYDPYVGSDCSVDKHTPPEMHGLLDDGLCDEREMPCTDAHFFAHPLIDSSTLTCHISKYKIYLSGVREHISNHTVAAEFRTIAEGLCPLEAIAMNRDYVHMYTVAVSYDGIHASNKETLYIFDSTCQVAEEIDKQVHFSLMDQFCFIEGECIAQEELSTLDNCSICNTSLSLGSWSTKVDNTDCLSTSAIPVIASTNEASEVPSITTTDLENPTTPISTPGSYGRTTLHTTMAGTSESKLSKSITVSNTILMSSETTKTETKTPDFEATHTSTSPLPESTRTMMPSTNAVHSASTTSTQASVDQSSSPNTIALTQSSKSIHSFTAFITTKRFSSTKENVDTTTRTSSYNGLYSSDTTSLGFSETESETDASTDESPPAQSKNSLWMIGAIVPSVIVLAIIITVGVLLYLKKSTKKLRIQSSTNLHVGQFTALSRQNTTTSIATTSDMSFTCANVNPSDYHPPPKPDMSFEEST